MANDAKFTEAEFERALKTLADRGQVKEIAQLYVQHRDDPKVAKPLENAFLKGLENYEGEIANMTSEWNLGQAATLLRGLIQNEDISDAIKVKTIEIYCKFHFGARSVWLLSDFIDQPYLTDPVRIKIIELEGGEAALRWKYDQISDRVRIAAIEECKRKVRFGILMKLLERTDLSEGIRRMCEAAIRELKPICTPGEVTKDYLKTVRRMGTAPPQKGNRGKIPC